MKRWQDKTDEEVKNDVRKMAINARTCTGTYCQTANRMETNSGQGKENAKTAEICRKIRLTCGFFVVKFT